MRFTIHNMLWLTVVVAIAAGIARMCGADGISIIFVLACVTYLFAPLVAALASSFFQRTPPQARKRTGYRILFYFGGMVTLASLLVDPLVALFVAFVTGGLWVTQIEIFNEVHTRQAPPTARDSEDGAAKGVDDGPDG